MQLVQISAWNDSGGGFLHRLFDGHPGFRVWPFELLLGRDDFPVDRFGEDWFRGRYRWPRLGADVTEAGSDALFERIADTELKAVLAAPEPAKHADYRLPIRLEDWRAALAARWAATEESSQAAFLAAYCDSFFDLLGETAAERPVLGHCPVAILDAPETWSDFPEARFICVVRAPLPGYADMQRRHPDLSPERYAAKWSLINAASLLWARKAPDRVCIVTLDQLLKQREATMRELSAWLGVAFSPVLLSPSWRGQPLREDKLGPFGGIPELAVGRDARLAQSLAPPIRRTLEELTCAISSQLEWC